MTKGILKLFIACGLTVSMVYTTDKIASFNVKRLIRKTGNLQREVDEIWELLNISLAIDVPQYGNRTRADNMDNISRDLEAKVNNTVATADKLKLEVKAFITTSRIGFGNEKMWQRENSEKLTGMVENIQTVMTEDKISVEKHLGSIDAELAKIDQSCKENNVQLQNINAELNKREHSKREELEAQTVINEQLSTILGDLKAKLEIEKEAHSQAMHGIRNDLETMKTADQAIEAENQALRQTILEIKSDVIALLEAVLPCDEGWSGLDGHCYLVVEESKTWNKASASCRRMNSYLIELTTDAEVAFAAETLVKQYDIGWYFWIGATDREREGHFVYQHSQLQVPEKYWGKGEPDNYRGNEDCARMGRARGEFEIFDGRCDNKNYFVCEKP